MDDILDFPWTEILEREAQLVEHLIADDPADADSSGLGHRLQPRGDVDTVAEDVVALGDDVAEIDADAPCDALILRDTVRAPRRTLLNLDRAAHCFYGARKLDEDPIAHRFDDATCMLSNDGVDDLPAMRLESGERAFLVRLHQPAVAGDIGGKNSGEAALGAYFSHLARLLSENAVREIVLTPR